MSTTFTPARPSVVGAFLHTSGFLFGRMCRFTFDFLRETTRSRRYVGQELNSQIQKLRPAPQPKPRKHYSIEEMEQTPAVLRLTGQSQEDWYRINVLEPEAHRLAAKQADDDEYFSLIFTEPEEGEHHV
ncbi:MAG: hypothetical protein LBE75_05225 [Burkholderiales bacterium]|jgi:hypothetical protein|nr:hypothetical protein [Burkholderiales bacterium]